MPAARPRSRTLSTPAAYATTALLGILFAPAALAIPFTRWPLATEAWILVWGAHAVMLAATVTAAWQITHRLGTGVRDGLGLFPSWARTSRLLLRMEYQHQPMLVFSVGACAFLLVRVGFFPLLLNACAPEASGTLLPTLIFLVPVQISTALITELVLVGLVVTLLGAAHRPAWEAYLVSALARVALGLGAGWAALALAPLGLTSVWLYRRTRRLTPLIIAHASIALAHTLTVVWISSISDLAHTPALTPFMAFPLL